MRFADWPLKRKLATALVLSSVAALCCALGAILLYESGSFRPKVSQELQSLGTVMVEMTTPAVVFMDAELAGDYLNVLRLYPQVSQAALLQADLQPFALYQREQHGPVAPLPVAPRPGVHFAGNAASLWLALQPGQTDTAWLYLNYQLPALWQRLPQYSIMALALGSSLLLIAGLLWWSSGRYLIRPLLQMTDFARTSMLPGAATTPLQIRQRDELGALASAFTELLGTVQLQNEQLRAQLEQQQLAASHLQRLTTQLEHSNADLNLALDISKAAYWHLSLGAEQPSYQSGPRLAALCGDLPAPDWVYPLSYWYQQIASAEPAAAEAVSAELQQTMDSDQDEFDVEYPYRRPADGQVIWLHTRGRMIRNMAGEATELHAVTQDLSDKKHAEQLQTAKASAEAANLAKSAFLANMSHEIRTPMNAIIGLTHLALGRAPAPAVRQYLQKVQQAAQSLLGIINDILDFSKIEAGKLTLEQTDFNLDVLLQSVTTVTAAKAADKQLEYLIEVDPAVPRQLQGDPLRLSQVLTNLVSNAIKFTAAGEVRLQIRPEAADAELQPSHCRLLFQVCDTGIGLSPAQQQQLFQPFSQADQSTTRQYGGTGLGLSISQRLVELMGGAISCQSEPGQGSCFAFSLQLALATEPSATPGPLSLKVLVVDDHQLTCDIVRDQLQLLGCQADIAQSALVALQQVRQAQPPYDVVITDWRMPSLDGLELCRQLKAAEGLTPRPQLVLMTAFGAEEVRTQALAAGVDAVLAKPVNVSVLCDTLQAMRHGAPAFQSEPASQLPDFSGVRLLLTEDNAINRQIATELLLQAGATVDCAGDGAQALQLLREHGPGYYQLILMDLQMPVLDGHQAVQQIRQWPEFNATPVIAMTAHALASEKQQCLDEGMNDHIAKPIDPTLFYQVITEQLRRSGWQVGMGRTTLSPAAAGFPQFPGFDCHHALKRLGGNQALYLDLLQHFANDHADWPVRLMQQLCNSDWPALSRDCHLLKGVAGNIGASEIARIAALAELRLKEPAPAPAELFTLLCDLSCALLNARLVLCQQLPERQAPAVVHNAMPGTVDIDAARAGFTQLLQACQQGDIMANQLFLTLTPALQQWLPEAGFAALKQATDQFDYVRAATLLQSALASAIPEQ